ncbi:MAG: hypothetical protein PHD76_13300 [Methylacidiphilales bacterium]|nr:hypothetical protein [Candidatus Methylacidiphilales bacterium]
MKAIRNIFSIMLCALPWMAAPVHADGIPGKVEWSDGRKITGPISLTPGKDIRLFEGTAQVSLRLADIRLIEMIPEKEEMREGFAFIEPGQARTEKTGEVYPVRYLHAKIALRDGKVLEGHLYTTVLYVETGDTAEKVVLLAKQTGKEGQKIEDVPYPASIRFDSASSAASSQMDLAQAGLAGVSRIVVVSKPDLTLLDAVASGGGAMSWTIPFGEPSRILFAVESPDGIHVAWPVSLEAASAEASRAVEASLVAMRDFYDVKKLIGCFYEADKEDVYALVMLSRAAQTHSFEKGKEPWTLAVLRWKYDADEKKTTLLNRMAISTGRSAGDVKPPVVFKDEKLLFLITPAKERTP